MANQLQNQRQFFRLETLLDVKFKIPKAAEPDHDILFLNAHQGQIIDLSGGGAVITSKAAAEPGALIKLKISNLGLTSPIEASVIRVENLSDGSYKYAAKFESIGEEDVKKILGFLNQELLKQSRKLQ
ncbi:MAG: PilZ domain-containing protein [Thermincola sp.]|jgi:c-di-GMP-binding flagellar brake protein YcgR|nr:PilZ domain-containing protein [Thermincola sp.]MDT3703181.1 PilZ domain-containing protein [Thermincola sp.]